MPADDLTRMANQIADFFASYPEAEAAPLVADHIRKFWARQMREDLAAMLAGEGAAGLTPLARRGAEMAVA
ncbi:MAG: formate dehydrogenase subunit delta, partial [Alphaproteobacteria bacterium]